MSSKDPPILSKVQLGSCFARAFISLKDVSFKCIANACESGAVVNVHHGMYVCMYDLFVSYLFFAIILQYITSLYLYKYLKFFLFFYFCSFV